MNGVEVTNVAQTKDGMTLGDMMQFIQEADRIGIDPRTVLKIRTGWRSQIMRIRAGGTQAP